MNLQLLFAIALPMLGIAGWIVGWRAAGKHRDIASEAARARQADDAEAAAATSAEPATAGPYEDAPADAEASAFEAAAPAGPAATPRGGQDG